MSQPENKSASEDSVSKVHCADGTSYVIYLPNKTTDHIQKFIAETERPYEAELLQSIIENTDRGDLIIDIGANVGNHTLYLAHHGRKVIAFEPSKHLAQALQKSIKLNSFQDDVEVFCIAVGATNGHGMLNVHSQENLGMGKVVEGNGDIEIRPLDTQIGDAKVKAIKIDVEGMEEDVLKGAQTVINRSLPELYIEIFEEETFSSIIRNGLIDNYYYTNTFNNTPTHLFIHKNNLPFEAASVNVSGTTILALAQQKQDLIKKNQSLEYQIGVERTEVEKLGRSLGDLQDKSESLAQLLRESQANVGEATRRLHVLKQQHSQALNARSRSEAQLSKLEKKYTKTLRAGLMLSAPMIILLSPLFAPILAIKAAKKKLKKIKEKQYLFSLKPPEEETPKQLDKRFTENSILAVQQDESTPLVSIIIPSFNREKYLPRAIRSALSQTYGNLEVIVVDDGSSDGSLAIAHSISEIDARLKVIPLKRNFGCYYARNIGVMHSKGKYIGICDSDDILSPNRIVRQVAELSQNPNAVACLGRIRRWSGDFDKPLSDLLFGENSLLWERKILTNLGWYDTCRFGADSEFRERIIARYGKSAICYIDDELYFLRISEGSLALSTASSAYTLTDGVLDKNLSPNRFAYQKNFKAWHAIMSEDCRIGFPQLIRAFDLGCVEQNASPSLGQKRFGAMASYPKRQESLRKALPIVLSQVDELILYLNDYDVVPDFCSDERLTVILGKDALGDLRDNGKFYDLPVDENTYIFTFDDDIQYPSDYVQRMVHEIEALDREAVVGVHGVNFPDENFSDLSNREVFHFSRSHSGSFVDLLGTGTTAWHSSLFRPNVSDFPTKGVCDLWFTKLALKANIPLFCVPRDTEWLQEISGNEETLFSEAQQTPQAFFSIYNNELKTLLKGKRDN